MNVHSPKMILPLLRNVIVSKVWGSSAHTCRCPSLHIYIPFLEKKAQEVIVNHYRLFSTFVTEVPDVIDTFTDILVQEKTFKWESHTRKISCILKEDSSKIKEINTLLCSENIDQSILDKYVSELLTINIGSIKYFLSKCVERKVCPSKHVLHTIANVCAQCGDKKSVQAVQNLCLSVNAQEYQRNAGYVHYIAEASWVNGNVETALGLFLEVYDKSPQVRRNVRFMLKFLITDAVVQKSEATLVLVKKFALKLIDAHKDYSFLAHLWEACFQSQWYSDNQLALDLLEEHEGLRDELQSRIPSMACVALQSHNVSVVQKLFDIVLKYDMAPQRSLVLRMLFDYACSRGDMKACTAIIRSLDDLNVTLTTAQHEMFLYVFCNERPSNRRVQAPSFYMKF